MELQHFLHHHTLIFNQVLKKERLRFPCHGCLEQVSGPNYTCKEIECRWFILHKSCAELSRKLQHPLHPKRPLHLIHQNYWNRERKCEGCNGDNLRGLVYSCSDCNFNLERKCASLPLTMEVESHAHPLTLVRRSNSFTCDACGKEGKGMFYLCSICPLLVHLHCTSYPLRVKLFRHTHPLHLTNSLHHLNQSDQRLCLLCVKNVDTNYMPYYCSTCDFATHLDCATNKQLWDETFVPESKGTDPTESTSLLKGEHLGLDESNIVSLPYVVVKSKLGVDKNEIPVEIKHFSHDHDLKLIDEQFENEKKCDGCMWPIYPRFYTCTQCAFFLHKSCVELPRKKLNPLHRHPPNLFPEATYGGKYFVCNACWRSCNGFVYNCDKCKFDLDIQCSLITDFFIHDGHEHGLILSSTPFSKRCGSCDSERSKGFCCANCQFTLDYKCATLPRIRYGPHKQPFTLCYKADDDHVGKYYCDICEEERNPKHWYYYCKDLDFPVHPYCILGKYPYIKFEKIYTSDLHKHPLIIVERSEGIYPSCDKCGFSCYDLTFECVKCNFNLHGRCL